jgi:hypothetical protein
MEEQRAKHIAKTNQCFPKPTEGKREMTAIKEKNSL